MTTYLVAAGPVGLGIIVAGAGVAIGLPIGNAIGNHFFGPQTYTGYGPTFPPIMHAKGARENTGKNQGENERARRATRDLDDDEQDDFHHEISRDADFNNASPEDLKEEADALRKSRELPGRTRWKGKMPKGGRGRSKGDMECP